MNTFLVVGLGRFGSAVARSLGELGKEVLAIDEDPEAVQRISETVTHAVAGDATDEAVLRSVGAGNFDCAVVAIASGIENSVIVTSLLKEFGVPYVVAKARDRLHMRVLRQIGADRVVFPEEAMGTRVARSLAVSNIVDFLGTVDDFTLVEISAPPSWAGKTLAQLNVRMKYGLNVLLVNHGGQKQVSPGPDQIISNGDTLVVIGADDRIDKIGRMK